MTRKIDEIDFQALVSDEKVTSTAEIVILNREAVVGGVLQEDLSEVAYRAFPSALVEKTTLDAAGLKLVTSYMSRILTSQRTKTST